MPEGRKARRRSGGPGSSLPERERWASTYRETPYQDLPWFHTFPEPWIVEAVDARWVPADGRVLDIGCGAGTNVLWLSERGYDAVGLDIAPGAVRAAEERRRDSIVRTSAFVGGDVLLLPFRDGAFATVSDVGCFHALPLPRRGQYARELARVLRPGGKLLLCCFAREETMDMGPPHRLSVREMTEVFEHEFLFERTEYREEREGGASFRSYQVVLRRRTEPQPPAR